ncbi:MAG: GNAT family N-acetyltransferase [Polyangiaceae bacterium]|nr:GNAT family N-acetyltransferase [Polyangiaceae bacterium]MCW5790602.1 GNAT family N-acetyltransferase [Polyangiaceae bacterium]
MLTIPSRTSIRGAPVEGLRTLLCPIEPADGPDLWTAVDGSRWHLERWLPWVPFNNSPEASQRYAEVCAQDWDAGRAVRLAIRSKATRELLGVVGLDAIVHLHRSCELGYWLRRDVTGQGLMTEAAAACLRFAFETLGAHRVRCAAATENYASLRVIMRLGFCFEGIARQAENISGRWIDHAVFAKLATDDRAPRGAS